jgi:hypothetical protein
LSLSDSAPDLHQDQIEETDNNWAEEDLQIQAQMQLLDERLSRHDKWWAGEVAKAGERAAVAAEEHLLQGPIESAGEEGDSSSLSTVSSSRYEGLEEWWKEDSEVVAVRSQEQIGNSEALAVRSRGKRVRYE